MSAINYELIILARETMGFTQEELAEKLFIKQSTLSKIEHGLSPMPVSLLSSASEILEYPESFFYQEWKPIRVEGHYRKKSSLPVKMLKECKAKMTMAERHFSALINSMELPPLNLPKWDVTKDGSPSMCAKYVREFWKVPKGRIENLTQLIEDNGITIIELDLSEMEGFTTFSQDNLPIIFINRNRSGDRDLFTKAHEIFHAIAHFGKKISADRDIDKEADEFASEFLLPEKDIVQDLVKLNIAKLADLKRYWKVSMGSMIMKAKKTNMINQSQYEYLWKQMSSLGYRVKEPIETPRERATLFQEILNTYIDDFSYSKQQLGKVLNFRSEKIDEWYFNIRPNRLKILRKAV